ncbi:hypothetical protein CEXT_754631 [Caerostris extrusa]|uniref:Uncharacterized protein n=1 Tax=Caerostris extrusa TaxID=172846 RepID=A0AAV4N1V1_CAEEX|nr:hypothetical protein CEXT_754631 [Caerostris extrusa]
MQWLLFNNDDDTMVWASFNNGTGASMDGTLLNNITSCHYGVAIFQQWFLCHHGVNVTQQCVSILYNKLNMKKRLSIMNRQKARTGCIKLHRNPPLRYSEGQKS